MLSINTGATYSHNKSYSEYSEEEALAINDVREKAWDMYLTANLRKKLGKPVDFVQDAHRHHRQPSGLRRNRTCENTP